MAFKMNRPVIKGTPIHKASIAKAESEPMVEQTRIQANDDLANLGTELGNSYIPPAIDFSIDYKKLEAREKEEEKGEEEIVDKKNNEDLKPGQYLSQEDLDIANAEARRQFRKKGSVSKSGKLWDGKQWVEKSIYQSKSPVEMRDDRVYENAQVDGTVRKNMIKGGYTPKN